MKWIKITVPAILLYGVFLTSIFLGTASFIGNMTDDSILGIFAGIIFVLFFCIGVKLERIRIAWEKGETK